MLFLEDDDLLSSAEREISNLVASTEVEFEPPPYSLHYLQDIHRQLFRDIYDWAGKLRTIDISKGATRFCTVARIEVEADKVFQRLAGMNWLAGLDRSELVGVLAECYGDLNMVHPFRDGNGRAQRVLFEHLAINAGFTISWWQVDELRWLKANVAAVGCDYQGLVDVFAGCLGVDSLE